MPLLGVRWRVHQVQLLQMIDGMSAHNSLRAVSRKEIYEQALRLPLSQGEAKGLLKHMPRGGEIAQVPSPQ